jgi:hypothetical protein
LYILKAVSVATVQPRGRIVSVLLRGKKWLGTALVRTAYSFPESCVTALLPESAAEKRENEKIPKRGSY